MHQLIEQRKKSLLWYSFLALMAISCIVFGLIPSAPSRPLSFQTLPGQEVWKQGISSFLFGTNDTHEWSAQNIETQPSIQQNLRDAGFTLIRSFFQDGASDADIEQRIETIENSGASCLGVITNIFHEAYDKHLVQYLGNRCQMYEFGNEPDYNGISIEDYLRQWSTLVPVLRHINPGAKFIGPVLSTVNEKYLEEFLIGVKISKVLPDAISFHWYPCYRYSEMYCLNQADSAGARAQEVRSLVELILRKNLPIGITEWNFDPGNPPPAYGDNQNFIMAFSTRALQSMIQAGVTFACQFDAASFAGYGHLDLFDRYGNPKAQYYVIKDLIATYRL